MIPYRHTSGDTGIKAYEIIDDGIIIKFKDDRTYRYTYKSAGRLCIEIMKGHAKKGVGLTTYINQHVKDKYEEEIN